MINPDNIPPATLEEAKAAFYRGIEEPEGTECPCCGRIGKMYVRPFNRGMARNLVWLYQQRLQNRGYTHLPTTAPRYILADNQVGKLLFWGMVERKPNDDDPSKHKSGWYRITETGVAFIQGRITANSHVIEFNGNVFGWRDKQVTMSDVLGKPFHYRELMEDSPP